MRYDRIVMSLVRTIRETNLLIKFCKNQKELEEHQKVLKKAKEDLNKLL